MLYLSITPAQGLLVALAKASPATHTAAAALKPSLFSLIVRFDLPILKFITFLSDNFYRPGSRAPPRALVLEER